MKVCGKGTSLSRLNQLGFPADFYQLDFDTLTTYTVARVIEQQKGLLKIAGEQAGMNGEWWAEPSGRLHHEAEGAEDLPVVGDWVLATAGSLGDRLQILKVLPRQSLLKRRAIGGENDAQLLAANVDHIFIVSSLNQDLNLNRLDRFRALADQSGVGATLLLTKSDLIADQGELEARIAPLRSLLPLLVVSSLAKRGLDEVEEKLRPGSTYVFIGTSGVGKSTLINSLLGEERQDTSGIRESDDRGRHTTSSRSLIPLKGGALLIDTPGLRELGLWNASEATIDLSFDSLSALAQNCRYRDCKHQSEPGCAVQAAIESGALDASRLTSYQKLQKEREYYERKQDKQKMTDTKKRWKSIHKSMRKSRKDV